MVQEDIILKGRTVVITRPWEQAEETGRLILQMGGKPYFLPTIEIEGSHDLTSVKAFVETLTTGTVDYVIFMSVNGVQQLLNAAEKVFLKDKLKKSLNKVVTIAVGPKTAEVMDKNQIHVSLVPEKYTSEGILQTLAEHNTLGKVIFIPRTHQAPPELAETLRVMGNRVVEIYVYESVLPSDNESNARFLSELAAGRISAIVFSSSLGARNLFEMLKKNIPVNKLVELLNTKTTKVAIGPTTAKTLQNIGLRVDVMPEKHLFKDALFALAAFWS